MLKRINIFSQNLFFILAIWSVSQELSFDNAGPRQSSVLDHVNILAFERGFEAERLRSAERSVDEALREDLPSNDSVFHEDSGVDADESYQNVIAGQLIEILGDEHFPNEVVDFPVLLDEDEILAQQDNNDGQAGAIEMDNQAEVAQEADWEMEYNHMPPFADETFNENNPAARIPDFPMMLPDEYEDL